MKAILKTIIMLSAVLTTATASALSSADNLGTWRGSSSSERSQSCEVMVKRLSQPGLSSTALCNCITETAGDGGLDFMKVSETAASCALLLK